jgi:hypothetical protein
MSMALKAISGTVNEHATESDVGLKIREKLFFSFFQFFTRFRKFCEIFFADTAGRERERIRTLSKSSLRSSTIINITIKNKIILKLYLCKSHPISYARYPQPYFFLFFLLFISSFSLSLLDKKMKISLSL